jgi:hypothetical protein
MLDAYLDPFKALMDSTKDSVYLLGRVGRFLFVNKTHLDRMGLRSMRLSGATIRTSTPPRSGYAPRAFLTCPAQ